MPDLEDDFRELQSMHDVEHRKEQLLDRLEMFAEAASLPSQHFIRCSCGANVRKDITPCPVCGNNPRPCGRFPGCKNAEPDEPCCIDRDMEPMDV